MKFHHIVESLGLDIEHTYAAQTTQLFLIIFITAKILNIILCDLIRVYYFAEVQWTVLSFF